MTVLSLIEKLYEKRNLSHSEWCYIFENYTENDRMFAQELAKNIAIKHFGKNIFFRGIIEFTNICKNDCYYCGLRCSNKNIQRYRLSKQDIIECANDGYENGFRTFVLQGGEDGHYTDNVLCDIVSTLKKLHPDCAITLSVGERSRESYENLYKAGADRYLLRHEAADQGLYAKLHPKYQLHENRIRCLYDLREIGYQTGCGFMIGVHNQTMSDIATDMMFIQDFKPHMLGLGPFIPHKDTPFGVFSNGSTELTLLIISLSRILLPNVLMPSTTALGTVRDDGRKLGILAGCNVVMPNLSPMSVRKKYMLYDNKAGTDCDAATGIEVLKKQMEEIGYRVISARGDYSEQ